MLCTLNNLRSKEVVNMKTGEKIGFVDDVEIDTSTGQVVSFVVYGRARAFGIMGRDEDIIIKCKDIDLVGEDTILVRFEHEAVCTKSRTFSVENLLK